MPNKKSSTQNYTLDIAFTNSKRHLELQLICETSSSKLTFSPTNIQREIRIGQTADMSILWDDMLSKIKPIETKMSINNSGNASANIKYAHIVLVNGRQKMLSSTFLMKPDQLWLKPSQESTIQFQYYAVDLRDFSSIVNLKSNSSETLLNIPYYLKFKLPILQTTPHALFDIGLINFGKSYKSFILLHNIGQISLRIDTTESVIRQSFVKSLPLQHSQQPVSINHPIGIDPGQQS
ncbi:unnamed protein product [Didymodactylos carnosus]|uniref:Uncharacterized protein n=1 Tax=Didymodactylos carnosus TaxID=1234261 RepID=A0A814JYU4_9BILA|nr:unnamed protein product [Didymodactylos carnosus]CAF3815053.1 unnamed protein product [Didymodactylos carnosus]